MTNNGMTKKSVSWYVLILFLIPIPLATTGCGIPGAFRQVFTAMLSPEASLADEEKEGAALAKAEPIDLTAVGLEGLDGLLMAIPFKQVGQDEEVLRLICQDKSIPDCEKVRANSFVRVTGRRLADDLFLISRISSKGRE